MNTLFHAAGTRPAGVVTPPPRPSANDNGIPYHLAEFRPLLNWAQIEAREACNYEASRRAVMSLLTLDGRHLLAGFRQGNGIEALLDAMDLVRDYQHDLHDMTALSEAAANRILALLHVLAAEAGEPLPDCATEG